MLKIRNHFQLKKDIRFFAECFDISFEIIKYKSFYHIFSSFIK